MPSKRHSSPARTTIKPCRKPPPKRSWVTSPIKPSSLAALPAASLSATADTGSIPPTPKGSTTTIRLITPLACTRYSNIFWLCQGAAIRRSASRGTLARARRAANAGSSSTLTSTAMTRSRRCTGPAGSSTGISCVPSVTQPTLSAISTRRVTATAPAGTRSTSPARRVTGRPPVTCNGQPAQIATQTWPIPWA